MTHEIVAMDSFKKQDIFQSEGYHIYYFSPHSRVPLAVEMKNMEVVIT